MEDKATQSEATATEHGSAATAATHGRTATLDDLRRRAAGRFVALTRGLPARRLALPFLLIGLLLVVRALLAPAPTLSTSAVVGSAAPLVNHYAPDITLTDPSGKHAQLSNLRGNVVLLTFWSASCNGCQSELSALERVYQQGQTSGFVVIGLDTADNAQTAASFTKRDGITFPIAVDASGRAVATYRVTKTPSAFLIDRFGVIRATFVGSVDNGMLAHDLAQLLSEK